MKEKTKNDVHRRQEASGAVFLLFASHAAKYNLEQIGALLQCLGSNERTHTQGEGTPVAVDFPLKTNAPHTHPLGQIKRGIKGGKNEPSQMEGAIQGCETH